MKKHFLLFLAFLLAACQPTPVADTPQDNPFVQAWIDAPLPGSVFPPGDIQIVAHGSSSAGIAEMELSLMGGPVLATQSNYTSDTLLTTSFTWSVNQPGTYTLLVRALNTAGDWSGYAQTTITVLDESGPTDLVSEPTPTPTPPSVPASAPTRLPPTRTPTPGPTFVSHSVSTGQFYFYNSTCGPKQATFSVLSANSQVANMEFFYQLTDKVSGSTSGWDMKMMQSQGNGNFSITLDSDSLSGLAITHNYAVSYRFVAIDKNYQILAQSDNYGNLDLLFCR